MSRWLEHLEALGVLEEVVQEPPLPAVLLVVQEPQEQAKALAVLAAQEAGCLPEKAEEERLEEAVRFARSEAELGQAVEKIQAGFEAGHLSQAQAERLAALTLDTARQLARGLVNVPAAAFLGTP